MRIADELAVEEGTEKRRLSRAERARESAGVSLFSQILGVDLGTANTLIYERGKGIVLCEPSVVALAPDMRTVLAVGSEAREMLGRTPGKITAVRPVRDGVVANYELTHQMLRHFIIKARGGRPSWLCRTKAVICVPGEISDMERRAASEAAQAAGARDAALMEEPLAAALGASMDISRPRGSMIVDVGGGTTDIAVLSLSGIVERKTLRVGGDAMDRAIGDYVRMAHGLMIGERTAEEIKLKIGSVGGGGSERAEVRGRDIKTGLPRREYISAGEIGSALKACGEDICEAVRQTFEQTPPELAADVCTGGIVMTGGGALLPGLSRLMERRTGVKVRIADDPITAVARGAGMAIDEAPGFSALKAGVAL